MDSYKVDAQQLISQHSQQNKFQFYTLLRDFYFWGSTIFNMALSRRILMSNRYIANDFRPVVRHIVARGEALHPYK